MAQAHFAEAGLDDIAVSEPKNFRPADAVPSNYFDNYFDVPDPAVPPVPAAPPAGGVMPVPAPAPVLPAVPLAPDVPSAPGLAPLLHPPSIKTSAAAESKTRVLVEDIVMINPFQTG